MSETSKTDFNSPVTKGEMFDSKEDLKGIRGTKSPRLSLTGFKEKLRHQLMGLAEIQSDFLELISKNPDMPKIELYSKLDEASKRYGLSSEKLAIAEGVIDTYGVAHQKIEELITKYPTPESLFRLLTSKEPEGQVDILERPFSVGIICKNLKDYTRVLFREFLINRGEKRGFADFVIALKDNGVTNNGDVTESAIAEAAKSGGVVPGLGGLIDLNGGAIIAINDSGGEGKDASDPIFIHEEEHAWQNLLDEALSKSLKTKKETFMEIVGARDAKTTPEKQLHLRRYLRGIRSTEEEMAKKEILAYFVQGKESSKVFTTLTTGELYGGWKEKKTGLVDELVVDLMGEKMKPFVVKNVEKVFGSEYIYLIQNGIAAVNRLKDEGYPDNQVYALLRTLPLSEWLKVANRVLENK